MNKLNFSPIPKTASMREVQRNYRQLFNWVEENEKPLVLTTNGRFRVVVLPFDIYNLMVDRTASLGQLISSQTSGYSKKNSLQAARKIKKLAKLGNQKISLSDFVILDRENH